MSLGLSDKDCASHGDTRPADSDDDTQTHSCVFDCHTGHSGTVDAAPITIESTTRLCGSGGDPVVEISGQDRPRV